MTVDVAVIGAGPAGAAAAAGAARAGLRAVLIEPVAAASSRVKIGEALPPAARPLLRDLDAWERLERDGHVKSYSNESAWGSAWLRSTNFIQTVHGPGWHLDRQRFEGMLRETARAAGTLTLDARVSAVERAGTNWTIAMLPSRSVVRATWIIDCTGRCSSIARRVGARRRADDRLVALAAMFSRARRRPRADGAGPGDRDATTLVESAPHGWWYTARLPGRLRVVVYFTDASDATARHARTHGGFLALMRRTQHVHERVCGGGYGVLVHPRVLAAGSGRLDRFAGDGWLAAGDAAMAFDPLSGQGIAMALHSGLAAGRAVTAHFAGAHGSIDAYCDHLRSVYEAYRRSQAAWYRAETRWRQEPFWHDRQR